MTDAKGLHKLEALLVDLTYVREWWFGPSQVSSSQRLFAVFKSGGSVERLKAAIAAIGSLHEPLDIVVLSHLPRMPDGVLDHVALAAIEPVGRATLELAERPGPSVDQVRECDTFVPGEEGLSLLAGGESRHSPIHCNVLGDTLAKAAAGVPQRAIRLIGFTDEEESLSYGELHSAALKAAGGLREQRIPPSIPVIIFTTDVSVFLRVAWGCFLRGNPVLPLAMPAGETAVAKLIEMLATLPEAAFAVSSGDSPFVEELQHRAPHVLMRQASDILAGPAFQPARLEHDHLALLLITSGSTENGPKLVMQTHRAVLSYCSGASEENYLTDSDVSLNWFPLDHIGGLVMFHIRDVWLACDQLQVKTDWILANPLRWLDLMTKHRVTVSWAPNFAYALVNSRIQTSGLGDWDLSAIRILINGGEMIISEQATLFLHLLEGSGLRDTAMTPAWGMTETCSGVIYSRSFGKGIRNRRSGNVPVGTPIRGVRTRIAGRNGRIVGTGDVGDLEVTGAPITVGYYHNDEANRVSFTEDGWFKTGDVASIEGGEVVIRGRAADKIIINGQNYAAQDIEAALQNVPDVIPNSVAVLGVPGYRGDTDELVVVYSPCASADRPAIEAEISNRLRKGYGLFSRRIVSIEATMMPRGPIGKVRRSALRTIVGERETSGDSVEVIPDWFARPKWVQKALHFVKPASRLLFVVSNGSEIDHALRAQAEQQGYRVVIVETPSSPTSSLFEWSDPQFWRRVLRGFADEPSAAVVFTTPLAEPTVGVNGLNHTVPPMLEAILAFTQAWNSERRPVICRLHLIGTLEASLGSRHPHEAAVSAWLKSASAEFSWLRGQVVSFETASAQANAARILDEICTGDHDEDVLYTSAGRLVPSCQRVDMRSVVRSLSPIKRGGFYLVTGGLGGLGVMISEWLLRSYDAKLLLVGRTDPEASTPQAWARRHQLAELRTIGVLNYEAFDLSEGNRLSELVAAWEARYGEVLGGVFHLAGVLARDAVSDQDRNSLAAAFYPKSVGLQSLIELLANRPEAPLISFSSINGYFGGAGVAAHAAASAYQNARVTTALRSGRPYFSVSWSAWPELGQGPSASEMELSLNRGYLPIGKETGIASLELLLSCDPGEWLIGLNPAGEKMDSATDGPPRLIEKFRIKEGASAATAGPHAPAGSVAAVLSAIWCDTLNLPQVDAEENFFDIGGTSLIVPQIQEEIKARLGIKMPTVEIFKYPTVKSLAERLDHLAAASRAST